MIGREGLAAEELIRIGSYNALLKNSLPKEFQYYKADDESSHDAFRSALPRGLAWEVLSEDESMRAEDVDIYYDPAELIGGLLISPSQSEPRQHCNSNTWLPIFQIKVTGHVKTLCYCQLLFCYSCLFDESIHLFAFLTILSI
ncbi:hypothetical protein POTOM_006541 [Populus tomentosa]|uniref:Uncharacterized protein n=1 Tax=Populus tomentosa TaxID=118781 RepID=A0A8X8AJC5_POPTO|nr:hypothetical protein POTOM_006541 [Populus tomentosa]